MAIVNASVVPGDDLENLRLGTRRQYTSPWTNILDGEVQEFPHRLGEVPWRVSVIYSEQPDGRYPVEASGNVTIAYTNIDADQGKDITHVKITNNFSDSIVRYFQVRAM